MVISTLPWAMLPGTKLFLFSSCFSSIIWVQKCMPFLFTSCCEGVKWDNVHKCACKQKLRMFVYHFLTVWPQPGSEPGPSYSVNLSTCKPTPSMLASTFPPSLSPVSWLSLSFSLPPLPFFSFFFFFLFFLSAVLEAARLLPFKCDPAVRCPTEPQLCRLA